ncbi:hypothetical protein F4780DRAFT_727820 [Xylariomycetidae sp. FL0641]|nr:hypothetical protein F4780DRAFT_727820 [Xylariomycetidae sp. FL0641]
MLVPTDTERQAIVQVIFGESQATPDELDAFFKHYCTVVCPSCSGDAVMNVDTPALKSHNDVLNAVRVITQNPEISFDDFVDRIVDSKSIGASSREKQHVARLAMMVPFAIYCTPRNTYLDNVTHQRAHHMIWEDDTPFLAFMETVFQCGSASMRTPELQQRIVDMRPHLSSLKAWKLGKRYGIKVKGTDNLLDHLHLDRQTSTLKVYRHVSLIRMQLAKTKHEPLELSMEESLKMITLPPKLLLETLVTFHGILFPIGDVTDRRTREALEHMIETQSFDPQGLWYGYVRAIPPDMAYDYWGHRLLALYEYVKQPPPANAVVAWFERHTSERNALTVAILALFLSTFFGLLSFIVGLLQLLLSWNAI